MHARHPSALVIVPTLVAALAVPARVHASTSYWDYLQVCAGAAHLSCTGEWTTNEESTTIAASWANHVAKSTKPSVGQARANAQAPFLVANPKSNVTLTFRFVSPITGLPVVGPTVHHVLYRANLNHDDPTAFVNIGTSFASGSEFAQPYLVEACEPVIEAIPYDAGNNEVVLPGGGDNVARGVLPLLASDAVPGLAPGGVLALGGLLLGAGALMILRRRTA